MHASSFLGTLGHARAVVSARRTAHSAADREVWTALAAAHDAVCDLADLCTAGLPLPPLDHSPPPEADDAVAEVLEHRYRELAEIGLLTDGGDGWQPPTDQYGSSDGLPGNSYTVDHRLRNVAGNRVVPLSRTGPAAANWYVLCDLLSTYATALAVDCRTLADRQRIDGSPAAGEEWTGIADLLSALSTFVEHQATLARWIHLPDRETVETAQRAREIADELATETGNLR